MLQTSLNSIFIFPGKPLNGLPSMFTPNCKAILSLTTPILLYLMGHGNPKT